MSHMHFLKADVLFLVYKKKRSEFLVHSLNVQVADLSVRLLLNAKERALELVPFFGNLCIIKIILLIINS